MALHAMSRSGRGCQLERRRAHISLLRRLKWARGRAYDLSTGVAGPDANVQQLQR